MAEMRYATTDDVLSHLKINASNTAVVDRVTRLENALADAFDAKTGRSFGVAPTPEARMVDGRQSSVLVIQSGIVSVAGVKADNGVWDGAAWTGLTDLAADEYRLTFTDVDGTSYGIERTTGVAWIGPVEVTGVWPDQGTDDVPADVAEAVTYLTVKQYRRLTASPSDQVGPDGMAVPTPHGWDDPLVVMALAAHTVTQVIV
jgi:hypothetical protein